jgi:hypothetical protein
MTSKWAKRSDALYVGCRMVRQQDQDYKSLCRGLPDAADT